MLSNFFSGKFVGLVLLIYNQIHVLQPVTHGINHIYDIVVFSFRYIILLRYLSTHEWVKDSYSFKECCKFYGYMFSMLSSQRYQTFQHVTFLRRHLNFGCVRTYFSFPTWIDPCAMRLIVTESNMVLKSTNYCNLCGSLHVQVNEI